jgi:hypothetical protein
MTSISKLFTWTAVMQLAEQGRLDLKRDVNSYLDTFRVPDTFPQPITLEHLMTHTAGFEDLVMGIGTRREEDVLGLEEYLRTRLPWRIRPPGPLAKDVSRGHSIRDGLFLPQSFEFVNGLAPAGALSSTVSDMARIMIAHLELGDYGGTRILGQETARTMHKRLFTNDPRLSGNAHGFWERQINGLRIIGHGGDTWLFHSQLILIPEERTGLLVVYNTQTAASPARDELVQAFVDKYYPAPLAIPPQPRASARSALGEGRARYFPPGRWTRHACFPDRPPGQGDLCFSRQPSLIWRSEAPRPGETRPQFGAHGHRPCPFYIRAAMAVGLAEKSGLPYGPAEKTRSLDGQDCPFCLQPAEPGLLGLPGGGDAQA